MQTKLSRIFFSAFWEFPPNVCEKHLWAKLCNFFGDFNFDIFLTVLDFFHFLCFIFCWGLPHRKGVCILSILDAFYRINHFNSKWRVKYLVLFVVGAASPRPSRCKQNSREFCFSAFWDFPPNFCQTRLWAKLCNFFGDFNFDILLTVFDVFSFFVFHFVLAGWAQPNRHLFFPKVSCERVYLPSSCSALVGCGWSLLVCLCYSRLNRGFFATARSASTHGDFTHMGRAARMKHFEQLHFERLWRSFSKCSSLLRCWECFIKMKYQPNSWKAFTASAMRNTPQDRNTESMFPGSDHSCKTDAKKSKFQLLAFWATGSWEKWTGCSKWFLEHFQPLWHRWVLRLYADCWVWRNCAKAPARKLSQVGWNPWHLPKCVFVNFCPSLLCLKGEGQRVGKRYHILAA